MHSEYEYGDPDFKVYHKKITMKKGQIKTITILTAFIALAFYSCSVAKPITNTKLMLDEELAANSTTSSLPASLTFNSLVKIPFGEFEVIKLSNNRPMSTQESKTIGGLLVLSRTIISQYKDVYDLVVVSRTDTVKGIFSVVSSITERKPSTLDKIKNKDTPSDYSKTYDPRVLTADFRINGNNLNWKIFLRHYTPDSISNALSGTNKSLGELTNHVYPMSAKPLKIATGGKNRSSKTYHIAGISLTDKYGKTAAAMQIAGENKLWLGNQLNDEQKLAVAALFVAMVSSLKVNH